MQQYNYKESIISLLPFHLKHMNYFSVDLKPNQNICERQIHAFFSFPSIFHHLNESADPIR